MAKLKRPRFVARELFGEFHVADWERAHHGLPGHFMTVRTLDGAEQLAGALNAVVAVNPELIGNAVAANGERLKVHFGTEKIVGAVAKALGVQTGSIEPRAARTAA